MNLRQIELFLAVVRTRSFQKSARESFTTQSTVSQHIALLEEELGVQLLERSRRGVWLTEAGNIVWNHASRILGEVRATTEEIERFKGIKETVLRIAASSVPGTYLLPKVLAGMCEQFPGLSIDLKQRYSRQAVELILNHEADIGVVGNRFEEKGLHYENIGSEEIRLVISPGHQWALRNFICVADLVGVPIVVRRTGSGTEKLVVDALIEAGADTSKHTIRMRVESSEAVKAAVMAGMGISFLSDLAVRREIERGDLAIVAVRGLCINHNFYLVCRSTLKLPPSASTFWKLMLENDILSAKRTDTSAKKVR